MSAVKQAQFIEKYQSQWDELSKWLDYQDLSLRKKRHKKKQGEVPKEFDFPKAYRQLCHHYSLATSRMYSPVLLQQLNHLVTRGHQHLYSAHPHFWYHIKQFFVAGFPTLMRQEWRLFAVAGALFYVPFFAMIIAIQVQPDLVYSVMSGDQVRDIEVMYDPDSVRHKIGRERASDSDLYMFGYYIKNNTGIGFQNFAGGMLFGLGTLFFLIFNGLVIGAAAGHLTHLAFIDTFWGFVLGHGAFELTAIVISGAAGLKLAEALIMPRRKSRIRALIDNGKIGVRMMYGAATLFIIAAFVEAFWSSMVLPVLIKYSVAVVLWTLVIAYFWLLGRKKTNA